jgi:glutamate-1-semialdehyde 2,1-aminomutase
MDARARRLAAGIRAALERAGCPFAVVQLESIVDFKFSPGRPNRDYDDARAADKAAYAAYYHAMRERGILLPPSQNEVMFLSTEHGEADIDATVAALDDAFSELRRRGIVDRR